MHTLKTLVVACLLGLVVVGAALSVQQPPISGELMLSQMRQTVQGLEKECLEMAQRLRNSSDVQPKDKQALKDLVQRTFNERQSLLWNELCENTRRIEKLSKLHAEREQAKDQIVERRVEELLNPNVAWLKNEPQEPKPALPGESMGLPAAPDSAPASTPLSKSPADLPQGTLPVNPVVQNPSILTNSSDLLRMTPSQLRDLLWDKIGPATVARKRLQLVRDRLQADPENKGLVAEVQQTEQSADACEQELSFAKLQYEEIIKYLETSLVSLQRQYADANENLAGIELLFQKGSASKTEVWAASRRPRELEVEIGRVESLLRLYKAAGDVPGLNDGVAKADVTSEMVVSIKNKNLSEPRWIIGNCTLTNNPGGTNLLAKATAGTFARVIFEKVFDDEKSKLLLKFDVVESLDESTKRLGLKNGLLNVDSRQNSLKLKSKPPLLAYLSRSGSCSSPI